MTGFEPATLRLTAKCRRLDSRVLRAGSSDENLLLPGVRQRIVQRLFSTGESPNRWSFQQAEPFEDARSMASSSGVAVPSFEHAPPPHARRRPVRDGAGHTHLDLSADTNRGTDFDSSPHDRGALAHAGQAEMTGRCCPRIVSSSMPVPSSRIVKRNCRAS